MTNKDLMAKIRKEYGAVIRRKCRKSSVPEEFVAALIANESAGEAKATRFEPSVYRKLREVRAGKRDRYSALTQKYLESVGDDGLILLATSYGPTQVMGYNAIFHGVDPLKLDDPEIAIHLTLKMLAEACERWQLDPQKDFSDMMRVWNTGRPHGKTYHAHYVPRGLRRMGVYAALRSAANGVEA